MTRHIDLRPLDLTDDAAWLEGALSDAFGSAELVFRGALVDARRLPGVVAGAREGLAQTRPTGQGWLDLATLVSLSPGRGIGRALIAEVKRQARAGSFAGVAVTTTNDNLRALDLYQRNGFRLFALRPGAVDLARETLKPQIPVLAANGLPIRDEIELRAPA